MPHASERELMLGLVDLEIQEAEQLAGRRLSEQKWCEHARWKFHADQLRALRSKLAKARRAEPTA